MDHRGSLKKRSELEFCVEWSDGEKTWELLWDQVKKLSAVDHYTMGCKAAWDLCFTTSLFFARNHDII